MSEPIDREKEASQAEWLADKIPAYGDYAKEAASFLRRYARMIRVGSAHAELTAIHRVVMDPTAAVIQEADTFTIKGVKELALAATRPQLPANEQIAKLENQREVLLNALCRAIEIATGKVPNCAEITRRFLERGELPALAQAEDVPHTWRQPSVDAILVFGGMLCEWGVPIDKAMLGLRAAYEIEQAKISARGAA